MNKKVLTLCAGVLLVGGSAIFTVNAMNAGNEKVQTTYVVKANAEGVAGYKLSVVKEASYTWSLIKGDVYYLSPEDGYFLAKDGSIKSIKTSTPDQVTILEDLSISFDGKTSWEQNGEKLYLWKKGGTMQSYEGLSGTVESLALATSQVVTEDLKAGETKAAYITESNTFGVGAFNRVVNANTWTLTKEGVLSVMGKSSAYVQSDLTISYTGEATAARFVYKDKRLQRVSQEGLELKYETVYLTGTKFTLDAAEEGAKPVVLYAITDGKASESVAESAEEGSFILAQGIESNQPEVAYGVQAIASTEQGAAGAEYGHIDGIQFIPGGEWNGGLLRIVDVVPTAKVPVCIYYKVGKDDNATIYYLTTGGKWVKDAKTTWILVDGVLTTLDGKNPIEGVNYTPDGITGVDDYSGHDVIFELAQESLPATELNSCDYPLLSASEMDYNDYVILGGYSAGVPVVIVQGEGEEASLTNANDAMNRSAALWKVKKEYLNDGRYSYIFTNRETGEDLNIKGYKRFIAYDYNGGVQLLGVDVNGNISSRNELAVVFQAGINVTTSNTAATVIGFYQSNLESYSAGWLMHRYGSSFQLNFKNHPTYADKEWIGNVFDGADLVPVWWDQNDGLFEIAPENETPWNETAKAFLLKDRNTGLYIVLDYRKGDPNYSNAFTDFVDGGYPFTVLSESNLLDVLKSSTNTLDGKVYYPYFRINYVIGKTAYNANGINQDNVTDATPIECVEVAARPYSSDWYDVAILETDDKAGSGHKDLFVTVVSHCELADTQRPSVSFQNEDNIVHGEDATNNPLNYRYVNIKFKSGANMQFKNELGNWVNLDGKVLGIGHISAGNDEPMPTEADYFLTDKAEGQWAVAMQKDANGNVPDSRKFVFTNRENPEESIYVKSMHALGNNVYAVEYDNASQWATLDYPFGFYTAGNNERNQAMRDTLVITAAEGNLKLTPGKDAFNMDSYANWTKEDLQDRTFQLSIDASTQLYVTENEGKDSHFLGLTDDALKVTNWRLVPMTEARKHDVDGVKYLTQGTDSVYTISNPMGYVNGKFVTYKDTTAIIAYALQNIENNEYLTYDPSQNQTILSMMCDPDSKNYSTSADLGEAYRFVLKEKAKGAQKIESGAYNIIGVNAWEYENDGKGKYVEGDAAGAYYTLDLEKKLYGAATYQKENAGAIEVENAYVQPTSNDIFTIATTASQEYVLATPRDTVRIYGNEENDFLLFEKGQFLNLGNTGDIAPAMVLDTAYIHRPGNNRYQYLLVVNPDYIEPVYDQLHGGDYHLVEPDTMKGRFLVNQIDSAVIDARYHNNKFINDIEADEKELKLGFQWGYRTGDKLHLTDGQNGPDVEIIDLGTADFNKAKFAFKYVNQAVDETFKVQTAFYDYDAAVKAGSSKAAGVMNNEGYLKSVNGVIVVTNGYTHGEEFLMAPEESAATANESIAAEGAISVTATDGAVIIKGAEGKNVVIATILGKVVANETVNSDNETIAVPAGIAVVSVDGESFKVVVK